MLSKMGWVVYYDAIHFIAGFYTFMFASLMGILGIVAGSVRMMCDCKWKTKVVLNIGAAHKYYAYFILLAT